MSEPTNDAEVFEDAFRIFSAELGEDDVYKRVVLEEVFRYLMEGEK